MTRTGSSSCTARRRIRSAASASPTRSPSSSSFSLRTAPGGSPGRASASTAAAPRPAHADTNGSHNNETHMKKNGSHSLATLAIHGKHLKAFKGPVTTPIYQTSTYRFANSKDAIRYAQGDKSVLVYTRYHNPSVNEVEDRLALMAGTRSEEHTSELQSQ